MSASPDLLTIVKHPVPEVSAHELNKILLLVLGCAVQSDQKEVFIDRIRCMRTELQESIINEIQKVTNDGSIDIQALEVVPEDHKFLTVLEYLERIMKERDDYANGILEMTNNSRSDLDEIEYGSTGATTSSSSCNGDKSYKEMQYEMRSPSPGALERHAGVELAGLKAEVRKLRNEVEHQDDVIADLEVALKDKEAEILKLKKERLELVKDARSARDSKDEAEYLRSQLDNFRKLEAENAILRERTKDLACYKNMCDDFEKDNKLLNESITLLEDELSQTKRRLEGLTDLEQKLIESQLATKKANSEVEKERDRIEELLIENGKLETEVKSWTNKYDDLEKRLEAMQEFEPNDSKNNSLFSEIEMHNRSTILELQLENRKLRSQLDNSVVSEPGEMFDLKERLAMAEKQAEEKIGEIKKLSSELEVTKEARKIAESKLEVLKTEQEKTIVSLNETRRQLATVQSDFQNHKDDSVAKKIKELENQLIEKDQNLSVIEEEKKRAEGQLDKIRIQQKEGRNEIDVLRDDIAKFENLLASAERAKKMLENERNHLKNKASSLEDRCDELNAKLVNYENLERRLANNEVLLVEKSNIIVDLEADNRTIKQQMELEGKKTQRLREDLVCEKSRIGDLLARLRSVCSAIKAHGGKLKEEEKLEDDDKLIDIIDDVIMQALNAARREADALRLQQQLQIAELDDLKKDIEALRRAEGELNDSDDRVRELFMENKNIKEQVSLLQERLRKLQVEDSTKSAELQAARREIEELQTKNMVQSRSSSEIAKLQVQLRNAQVQEDLLKEENKELQKQIEVALKTKIDFEKKLQSIEATQNALIADYDRLQNLHQLLGADYDRAKFELLQLKQKMKQERISEGSVRSEFLRVEQRIKEESLHEVEEAQREIFRLQKELDEYKKENSSMLRNADERSDELRRLRVAECSQKSTINSLNTTIQQLNHVLSGKDMEIATLKRQVEMLRQYNGDENQSLIKQIELLLVKNQELHERSLNDKDTFHAVQRDLQEQLVTLRRNKEKLEEKIMDQYKSMDSKKIKEKQTFVKRAAKALMPKNSSRKSIRAPPGPCGSTTEDSSVEDTTGFTSPSPQNQNGLNVPTTSCSSEQGSGSSSSPDYEIFPITKSETVVCDNFVLNNRLRMRNGLLGGSMRVPGSRFVHSPGLRSSIRTRPTVQPIDEDIFSLNGSERGVDVASPLIPNGIRHTRSVSNALHPVNAPRPPPYALTKQASKSSSTVKPPPPYPGRIQTPSSPVEFNPKDTSTPTPKEPLVPQRKSSSFYENVDLPNSAASESSSVSHSRAGSAVWFEYGCV